MPRVHFVQSARKARPEIGLEVGGSYYYWSFRYGGTHRSVNYPRPSQLTQAKYAPLLDFEHDRPEHEYAEDEAASTLVAAAEDMIAYLENYRDQAEEIAAEYEEAAEHFGGQGEHQERADTLQDWVSQLEDAVSELERAKEALSEDAAAEESVERREELCAALSAAGELAGPEL